METTSGNVENKIDSPKLHYHAISISEINRLAITGERFSVKQACEAILARGGILRTAMCETITDYFHIMLDGGFFEFIPWDQNPDEDARYKATPLFLKLAELFPDCVEKGRKIDVCALICEVSLMIEEHDKIKNDKEL